MKVRVPNYYKNFKCIADRCKHSCCIGWEIDIDEDTYALYRSIGGEMGHRLKESISPVEPPHFILDKQERCPFLNNRGLCDIITELGEDHLCDICADHPRFRNSFSNHTEMGLGLCCEAAAELILDQKEPVTFNLIDPKKLTAEEQLFFEIRDKLYSLLQDRTLTIEERLTHFTPHPLPQLNWKRIYRDLERLDPQWDKMIETINPNNVLPEEWAVPLEQLAIYFVYRHLAAALEDGRFSERLVFCALSVRVIGSVAETKEELPEIARMYSAEIEYSDKNIDLLLNRLG